MSNNQQFQNMFPVNHPSNVPNANGNLSRHFAENSNSFSHNNEIYYSSQHESGNQSGNTELSFSEFIKILDERKVVIGIITAVFFACTVFYNLITPDKYTAATTIEIGGYAPVLPGASAESLFGQDTRKQDYQRTTIAKLGHLGIVDRVLSKDDFATTLKNYFDSRKGIFKKFFGIFSFSFLSEDEVDQGDTTTRYTYKEDFLKSYLRLIKIDPVHDTSLVKVSATTVDPKLSERIANAHSEGFIDHLRKERQDSVRANLSLLQRKADELQGKVIAAEQKLAEYAKTHKIITLTKDENIAIKQISDLTGLLATATEKRIKSESLLDEIQKDKDGTNLSLDDEAIGKFRVSLAEADAEYANLRQKFKPNFPTMLSLNAKIVSLKEAIKNQRKQAVKALSRQYESDLSSEKKLIQQIELERARAYEVSQFSVQYNILQREYDSLKELYQIVLKQLQELMLSSAGTVSNIYISDYALVPQNSSGPLRGLILTIGLALGLLVGIITATVLHLFDNTIKSADDLQTLLRLPVLGIVPSFDTLGTPQMSAKKKINLWGKKKQIENSLSETSNKTNGKIVSLPLSRVVVSDFVTITHPQAVVSEAFRTIRVGILLSSADRPPRVVMVSSAKKAEGKTSFISNLAVTFAQASYKTLLIDTDIRQAKLNQQFDVPDSQHGLVDFLARQSKIEDIIFPTAINNLHLLPAGSLAPNPAELLGSKKMAELLEQLKSKYDYILVDSAPVLPVADSLILSRLVDGVIMMVRENETEKSYALEAKRRLSRVGANLLGVVVNDATLLKPETFEYRVAAVRELYVVGEAGNNAPPHNEEDVSLQKGA